MRQRVRPLSACLALVALLVGGSVAWACPFCAAPSLTLTEQLSQADAAVLVRWVDGEKGDENNAGNTTYEVLQIVKAPEGSLKKGSRITLARYRTGQAGDLFLLTGTKDTKVEWSAPLEVTEASFNYIVQAPSPELATTKRLEYFLKFLEYPDPLVANDAYGEFANAPYEDIAQLTDQLPREKIRKWVLNPETMPTRLGLYGLLIGMCGTDEDIPALENMVTAASEDFRLGIDGVTSGYLMLAGEDGLNVIEETKLRNKDVPFSETYAAMQALRFMWEYEKGRIEPDRLKQAMRILLDRPELADLVIADLARWKDWSVQDRLMKLYDAKEYSIPSIKRAIVRYLLVCSKDVPEGEESQLPAHAASAQKHLETLREEDPKTVQEAERFFFIN